MADMPARFTLLDWLYADDETGLLLGLDATVETWARVEIALAQARHDFGLIPNQAMAAIARLPKQSLVDEAFRAQSRLVGYPIIALVERLNQQLPEEHRGFLHLGATTQDIMDTGLVLQLRAATVVIDRHLVVVGDKLASLVEQHAGTTMPARTHGQIAVPTTFGMKLTVYLAQLGRNLLDLRAAAAEAAVISLHGAAGTSAALGATASSIRIRCAELLDLRAEAVPWHVARDRLVRVAQACANATATLVRLAREIVDLSRSEIEEVLEAVEDNRGASSTMPQKRNPILSEALIGLGVAAQASAALMLRAAEAGHERAAGEWQLEWRALPDTLHATASAARVAAELMTGLQVDSTKMRQHLEVDHRLVYAESAMIELARVLGRERAHALVYHAALVARNEDLMLEQALHKVLSAAGIEVESLQIGPGLDLAAIMATCTAAIAEWQTRR